MELKVYTTEEEIRNAWKIFGSSKDAELPDDAFREDAFQAGAPQLFALGLFQREQQTGLIFGSVDREETSCFVNTFYIDQAHAGRRAAVWFLDAALHCMKRRFGAGTVRFSMSLPVGQNSVILSLLKHISYAGVTEANYIRQICVTAEDCARFKTLRWYRPELLAEKGYAITAWKDAAASSLRQIVEAEADSELSADYLSPDGKGAWEKDEETSFLLLREGEDRPLGWIVTEKDEKEHSIMVRRFYVDPGLRSRMLGYGFLAAALEEITARCEKVRYRVERGNHQMERFSDRYKYFFGYDLGQYDYDCCNITVQLSLTD